MLRIAVRSAPAALSVLILAAALPAGGAVGSQDAALAGPNPACPDSDQAAGQSAGRFLDIDVDDVHAANIGCIAHYGITVGVGDGTRYAPGREVTRWQMALFLTRAAARAGVEAPDPPDQGFDDIADRSAAVRTAVNTAALLGLMPGASATTFAPDQPVTRSDMALFMLALLELTTVDSPVRVAVEPLSGRVTITRGGKPVPIDDSFTDTTDVVTAAEEWAVNAVYELGVAGGRADGSFDPYGAVTRGQMASFIIRALGRAGVQPDGPITLAPPDASPPAEEPPAPAKPPAPEPPAEEPPPADTPPPLPPDPFGVYTGDPLQLVAYAKYARFHSLPGSDGDRWQVWLCKTPNGGGSDPAGYAAKFTDQVGPWFDWMSGGQYRPVFSAGGEVSVGSSDDYYRSCRFTVYERYLSGQTEVDGAVIVVFDPADDSGVLGVGGFGCGLAAERGFPSNGRAVLINGAAVEDSTVLAHELGHALCWPHSYSGETYRSG